MAQNERSVIALGDLGKGDVQRAGGKGANLGEMVRAGFPVPPGFVITAVRNRSVRNGATASQRFSTWAVSVFARAHAARKLLSGSASGSSSSCQSRLSVP